MGVMMDELKDQSQKDLEEVQMMTVMIAEHQKQIKELGKRRKSTILRLRKNNVTYREIAEIMNVTEQNIYKILRNNIVREPKYDKNGNLLKKPGRPPKVKKIR
jgi:DNA invertase Pin-like site-specific DNA recombinase